MKRYAMLLLLLLLTACAGTDAESPAVPGESTDMADVKAQDDEVSFQAVVLEADDKMLLVEPVEGSAERSSADKIYVANEDDWKPAAGDLVEIEYDGSIMESYPAQLGKVYRINIVKKAESQDRKIKGQEAPGQEAQPQEIAALSLVDAMLPRYPDFGSPQEVSAHSGAEAKIQAGTYGGSPAEWCVVEDQGFVYFYYRFTEEGNGGNSQEDTSSGGGSVAGAGSGSVANIGTGSGTSSGSTDWIYSNYAVTGEDLGLACGIRPGMTRTQAQELVPDLYVFRWNSQAPWVYDWNPASYPNGWCQQFPAILVAQVENEADTPYCVGFMLDEDDVIRAVSFCWVTAG